MEKEIRDVYGLSMVVDYILYVSFLQVGFVFYYYIFVFVIGFSIQQVLNESLLNEYSCYLSY